MKKLDIIYGHYISDIQGINSVTNMFLHGKSIFAEREIELRSIIHAKGIFDCTSHGDIYERSDGSTSQNVKKSSGWKAKLGNIIKTSLIGEFFYMYIRLVLPAKHSIEQLPENKDFDYVIFQDGLSAYFFFKKGFKVKKSIWISHCAGDIFSAFSTGFPKMSKHKAFTHYYKKFYYETCKNVDNVVFLSPTIAQKVAFIPEEKRKWVFNGIESTSFIPQWHDGINIVSLGSVIERKGQRFLVEAMSRISVETKSKVHLYIAGAGGDMEYCKSIASELGVNNLITFCGQVDKVDEMMQKMDVMILASEEEGMPISIIEGMRQGVYTMVTSVGGCPDMLSDGVGEIIERDADAIAKSIDNLVSKKAFDLKMKEMIRQHFEDFFSLRKFINCYADILND